MFCFEQKYKTNLSQVTLFGGVVENFVDKKKQHLF